MKKTLLVLAAATLTVSASAQYEGNKFGDNWSLGIYGGTLAPVKGGDFLKNQRGHGGLEVTKYLTPYFGLGVQVGANINTTTSQTLVDQINEMFVLKANLSNIFCGWNGGVRVFEVEAVAGIGATQCLTSNSNVGTMGYATSRLGLNLNFNLGKARAWTIGLKPAIVYNLDHKYLDGLQNTFVRPSSLTKGASYNLNDAVVELTAGLTYHFRNSNKAHYFSRARLYDQAEVDALNAKVNGLYKELEKKDQAIADKAREVNDLRNMLNEERNKKPIYIKEKGVDTKSMEVVVTYLQGRTNVDASQLPNVQRIATYMKSHPRSTVSIKGYASPEGSAELNARIAAARAEAVRYLLINKYGIAENRIAAEGQGVGNMFEEPDWNRVAIAVIEAND